MLDENLPTYRLQTSAENPLHTLLYFSHNGSEAAAQYLLKRPPPSKSRNQFALGLLNVQYPSVVYAEVLVKPEWTQPTLSAAEARANGPGVPEPLKPDAFTVSLYNPDQTIVVRYRQGFFNMSESWEFEVPKRSFRRPSGSVLDQEGGDGEVGEVAPKVVFRWKRAGRMSKDMTCFLCGRSSGGKKSDEPDIIVAMLRTLRKNTMVTMYEPNMARVEVEDGKGLEVALLLSAEIIRNLYLVSQHDPFNTAGTGPAPTKGAGARQSTPAAHQDVFASGALANTRQTGSQAPPHPAAPPRLPEREAERRRQGADHEREQRELQEQEDIKRMLRVEEEEERRKREAAVDEETERLRKQYGYGAADGQHHSHPPTMNVGWQQQQQASGSGSTPPPQPNSVGSPGQGHGSAAGGGHHRWSKSLARPSLSSFFRRSEEDKSKKRSSVPSSW